MAKSSWRKSSSAFAIKFTNLYDLKFLYGDVSFISFSNTSIGLPKTFFNSSEISGNISKSVKKVLLSFIILFLFCLFSNSLVSAKNFFNLSFCCSFCISSSSSSLIEIIDSLPLKKLSTLISLLLKPFPDKKLKFILPVDCVFLFNEGLLNFLPLFSPNKLNFGLLILLIFLIFNKSEFFKSFTVIHSAHILVGTLAFVEKQKHSSGINLTIKWLSISSVDVVSLKGKIIPKKAGKSFKYSSLFILCLTNLWLKSLMHNFNLFFLPSFSLL